MVVALLGINHKTAPIEVREGFAFTSAALPAAVIHIFRVAAGLESMVLGEAEILGQVRNAYAASASAGVSGPILDRLFPAALHVGRRGRSGTSHGPDSGS